MDIVGLKEVDSEVFLRKEFLVCLLIVSMILGDVLVGIML